MNHENDHNDIRYFSIRDGVVIDRKDPLALGRIRARIPGLTEQTPWAFPSGSPGGGGKQRGFKWVPPMGAEVAIYFMGGDPDQPRYLPGHWGQPDGESEIPEDAALDASDTPEDVHAMEFDNWKILIDDRPGKETMRFSNKTSGDMIEFDGTKATGPGITIQASAGLYIKVDGAFIVDAISAVINGRKITDGSQNI